MGFSLSLDGSFPPQAFSSHPWCPQWHDSVVIPLASSQWVEQNFFPAGAIQVQAIWAHFVGVFAIESSSEPSAPVSEAHTLYSQQRHRVKHSFRRRELAWQSRRAARPYSFSAAQPAWPQSQASVVISFASSHAVEQYFAPEATKQVHESCAHFFSDIELFSWR
jgi:hypothetical protein